MNWFKRWIDDIRTTNLTIVVGLSLAVIYVLWALAAASWWKPIDDNTLDTMGLFIASLITGGITQFAVKRRTDDRYMAAKMGVPPAPRASTAIPAVGDANAAP